MIHLEAIMSSKEEVEIYGYKIEHFCEVQCWK